MFNKFRFKLCGFKCSSTWKLHVLLRNYQGRLYYVRYVEAVDIDGYKIGFKEYENVNRSWKASIGTFQFPHNIYRYGPEPNQKVLKTPAPVLVLFDCVL